MKTSKKLKIEDLKIQSFVTSLKAKDGETIQGAAAKTLRCITHTEIIESPCNITI